jgi:hypothetical protein
MNRLYKWLLWHTLRIRYVWIKDADGDIWKRRVQIDPFGGLYCKLSDRCRIDLKCSGMANSSHSRVAGVTWRFEYPWKLRGEYVEAFGEIMAKSAAGMGR